MPLIRSVTCLADGFSIVTSDGVEHIFTSDDLTGAQKQQTPAELEAGISNFLQSRLQGADEYVGLHLTSVVPLQGKIIIANFPPPDNWWQ